MYTNAGIYTILFPQRESQYPGVSPTKWEETKGTERHLGPGEESTRGAERPGKHRHQLTADKYKLIISVFGGWIQMVSMVMWCLEALIYNKVNRFFFWAWFNLLDVLVTICRLSEITVAMLLPTPEGQWMVREWTLSGTFKTCIFLDFLVFISTQ